MADNYFNKETRYLTRQRKAIVGSQGPHIVRQANIEDICRALSKNGIRIRQFHTGPQNSEYRMEGPNYSIILDDFHRAVNPKEFVFLGSDFAANYGIEIEVRWQGPNRPDVDSIERVVAAIYHPLMP
jgi:hypothetical protein